MNRETESISWSPLPTIREKPVPTGSIITRSARSSTLYSFSTLRKGPVVVGKHQRTGGGILAVLDVGREAEQGNGLVLVVLHQQGAGGDRIGDRLAADARLVPGHPGLRLRGRVGLLVGGGRVIAAVPCMAYSSWKGVT